MMGECMLMNRGSGWKEAELLWSNSSPESEMFSQTLPIDLTDYSGVLIVVHDPSTSNVTKEVTLPYCPKNKGVVSVLYKSGEPYRRTFYVTDGGVVVLSGVTGASTGDRTMNIPVKVYGVKGVKVE